MSHRLSIRAHYERFPLSVKGAFVLRAADGDPHQVKILNSHAVGLDGEGDRSLQLEDVTLEVAPNLDLFVPFEVPLAELTAGWYQLRCDLAIDADPVVVQPGKPFSMPWPRATTRRGAVGGAHELGGIHIEHVDCVSDALRVSYTGQGEVQLQLSADGRDLPVVDSGFDETSGKGKITAYPVMRTDASLHIQLDHGPMLELPLGA